jgi:hypothetical protein
MGRSSLLHGPTADVILRKSLKENIAYDKVVMQTIDDATLRNHSEKLVGKVKLIDKQILEMIRNFANAGQVEEKRKNAVQLIVKLTSRSLNEFSPGLKIHKGNR